MLLFKTRYVSARRIQKDVNQVSLADSQAPSLHVGVAIGAGPHSLSKAS